MKAKTVRMLRGTAMGVVAFAVSFFLLRASRRIVRGLDSPTVAFVFWLNRLVRRFPRCRFLNCDSRRGRARYIQALR